MIILITKIPMLILWEIVNFRNNNNFGIIGINNDIIENIMWNHNFRNNINHIIISFLYNSKLIIFLSLKDNKIY